MANLLTAEPQPDHAQVLLHLVLDPPFTAALVERTFDGGVTWAAVRGLDPVAVVGDDPAGGGEAFAYDTEAPLDTDVTYRATPVVHEGDPVPDIPEVTVHLDSDGMVWIKDPARPWADVRADWRTGIRGCMQDTEPAVTMTEFGAETFGVDASLSRVLNYPRPSDVFGVRGDAVTSAQWLSRTLPASVAMTTLFAWGGPILVQLPPVYGWDDRYYQPGDVAAARISRDGRRPQRLWDAPLTVVDAPVGPAQGVAGATWCDLSAQFATYGDIAASGLTWGDVVSGDAGPAPVGGYGYGGYGEGPYGGTA